MKDELKVAIYSGEVPSTTFIERLIVGIARENHQILLFGRLKKAVHYKNRNIKLICYSGNKLSKLLYFIKYSLLLLFFRRKEKEKLDLYILKTLKNRRILKIRYYPVLWHKPDLFHLQWSKSIADWQWVQYFGIKLIVSLRGAHINYSPLTEPELAAEYNLFFPKVDGFHAVSEAISKEAQKYGANPERIKVVYSGFRLTDIPDYNDLFNQSIQTIKILSVGRSHWKKGYNYALDACAILKKQNFNFQYTIIKL